MYKVLVLTECCYAPLVMEEVSIQPSRIVNCDRIYQDLNYILTLVDDLEMNSL